MRQRTISEYAHRRTRYTAHMRTALLLTAALSLATPVIASAADGPRTPSPSAADKALAKDAAAIAAQSKSGSPKPSAHVTLLGWADANRLAFRVTICSEDPLGGRGPWCDMSTCTMPPFDGSTKPELKCAYDVSSTLGEDPISAATIIAKARANQAALGVLAEGKVTKVKSKMTYKNGALITTPNNAKPVLLFEASEDDVGRAVGVFAARLTAQTTSPDGTCIGVIGIANHQSYYEGAGGIVPLPLSFVACNGKR
jgi:hypothetical protein